MKGRRAGKCFQGEAGGLSRWEHGESLPARELESLGTPDPSNPGLFPGAGGQTSGFISVPAATYQVLAWDWMMLSAECTSLSQPPMQLEGGLPLVTHFIKGDSGRNNRTQRSPSSTAPFPRPSIPLSTCEPGAILIQTPVFGILESRLTSGLV